MNDELQGVMRRVQKLLAIANDDRANPNEAAAAAQQAEKIMRKYQIDHADAMRSDLAQKDNFSTADCVAIMKRDVTGKGEHRPRKVPGWGGWLSFSVAKLNDCEIRYAYTARGAVIRFFGFAPDVQVASWTFDYLVSNMIGSLREYQKAGRSKAESESYRRGFVLAVCQMLDNETAKKKAAMQEAVTSRALVVVKAQAIAERFGDFNYRSGGDSSANILGDAYRAGREAGSKVALTQGVGQSTSSKTLRLN